MFCKKYLEEWAIILSISNIQISTEGDRIQTEKTQILQVVFRKFE